MWAPIRGIQTWGEAEIQGRFPDKIYPAET